MGKINWNKSVEKNKEIKILKDGKTVEYRVLQLEKEIEDLKKIIDKLSIK